MVIRIYTRPERLNSPLQLAAYLAIERRSLELLCAAISLGLNPYRHYATTGIEFASPLEHARFLGWDEGLAFLETKH